MPVNTKDIHVSAAALSRIEKGLSVQVVIEGGAEQRFLCTFNGAILQRQAAASEKIPCMRIGSQVWGELLAGKELNLYLNRANQQSAFKGKITLTPNQALSLADMISADTKRSKRALPIEQTPSALKGAKTSLFFTPPAKKQELMPEKENVAGARNVSGASHTMTIKEILMEMMQKGKADEQKEATTLASALGWI